MKFFAKKDCQGNFSEPNLAEQTITMGIGEDWVVKSVLVQEGYKIELYPEIKWQGHPIIIENRYPDNDADEDCICVDLY